MNTKHKEELQQQLAKFHEVSFGVLHFPSDGYSRSRSHHTEQNTNSKSNSAVFLLSIMIFVCAA